MVAARCATPRQGASMRARPAARPSAVRPVGTRPQSARREADQHHAGRFGCGTSTARTSWVAFHQAAPWAGVGAGANRTGKAGAMEG